MILVQMSPHQDLCSLEGENLTFPNKEQKTSLNFKSIVLQQLFGDETKTAETKSDPRPFYLCYQNGGFSWLVEKMAKS